MKLSAALTVSWCLSLWCCMPVIASVNEQSPVNEEMPFDYKGTPEWMQKGLELNGEGRYKEAADAFKQVVAVTPADAVGWFSLGTAMAFDGNYTEAAEVLKQAVQLDPDLMPAYSNLGAVYGRLGQFEDALDAYCQVLRLKPDDANARYNRGIVLAGLGDREAARRDYDLLIAVDQELAAQLLEFMGQEPLTTAHSP